MLKSTICPYLGLKDDPSTTVSFPSEGNYCHRAQAVPPVRRDYQRKVCMTSGHVNCPVFTHENAPYPPGLVVSRSWREWIWQRRWIAAPLVFLIFGWFLRNVWLGIETSWISPGERAAASSGGAGPPARNSPGDDKILASSTSAVSPLDRLFFPITPNPSLAPCSQPDGWVAYTVKPTDSLFLLSLVYAVSVSDLQRVNCLAQEDILRPGMTIYVPGRPTATAAPSPTITPTRARLPANPTAKPGRSRPQPTATPHLPTEPPANPQPPQPTPTDPPQPTSTQPAPAPTDPPPPTHEPRPTAEPEPTKEPRPTKEPKPTKEPRPTKTPKR